MNFASQAAKHAGMSLIKFELVSNDISLIFKYLV